MKSELEEISAKNDLDFYYNAENIPNQDLVFGTLEYFEKGKRKGFFEPLEFINLLWKQYEFVKANIQKPHTTIQTLKALPLNEEKKHVLLGFILKWFGGYPVQNMNKQYDTTLRLIEKEFLSFKKQTLEKQFCQKDWDKYSRLRQIEGFMADRINGKPENSEYDFQKLKEYLNTIPELKEKIKFLDTIKTEYQQNKTGWEISIGTPFDEQCELEIRKLQKIFDLDKIHSSSVSKSQFKISDKKGAKVDLLRIFSALYELRFVDKQNGELPTKKEFIEAVGEFLGTDFSKFQQDLSQAFKNGSIESNIGIFEKLKNITIEAKNKAEEKNK